LPFRTAWLAEIPETVEWMPAAEVTGLELGGDKQEAGLIFCGNARPQALRKPRHAGGFMAFYPTADNV